MPAERIYLDHAATTPMRPEAVQAMREGFEIWANPSSPHADGRAAREALEAARANIKQLFGWEGDLIFTSGATEALQIALGKSSIERKLISAVEHDAVFRAAPDAEILPVIDGEFDEQKLFEMLESSKRAIVALQYMNSETGVRQFYNSNDTRIEKIQAAGGVILCDCAQTAGKESIPNTDMAVVSAHKFGGPPGIGALLIKDFGLLKASGGQEYGYRGGTENLPAILGFAAALEAATMQGGWFQNAGVTEAAFRLKDFILNSGGEIVDGGGLSHAGIAAMAMPNKSAAAQLIRFDGMGISVSAGSACSSGSLKPSRTLKALGVPDEVAARTIRVGLGWNTTVAEIETFQKAWLEIANS